jgi:hypothetical protein
MTFILTLLLILVYAAVVYLILYLFSKYVTPIDNKVLGIILFIVAAILIIYALKGGSLMFW